MRTFEVLPHTADVRLRVRADSLAELHRGAIEGMAELLHPTLPSTRSAESEAGVLAHIDVRGTDQTARLIDVLSDVLTASLLNTTVFRDASDLSVADDRVTATVRGARVRAFDADIKAVTYHGAQIQRDRNGGYEVTVVFDI